MNEPTAAVPASTTARRRLPDTPEKRATRRFSEGVEQLPDTPDKRATGGFSKGVEQLGETREKRR